MTQRCGELAPNDMMIVADLGKRDDGVQLISTVAKVLSIRQTPEVTQANAAFIVRAVNAHDDLVAALKRAMEELRLIRMKDCNVVYDTTLRVVASLALTKAESQS
jgi:hypothetical protein